MGTNYYWKVHNLFYDEPGTPPDLRCIACKYVAATGLFGCAAGTGYICKKTIAKRALMGTSFALVTLGILGATGIALRMAHEDNKWNLLRRKEYAKELRRKRRESSGLPVDQ